MVARVAECLAANMLAPGIYCTTHVLGDYMTLIPNLSYLFIWYGVFCLWKKRFYFSFRATIKMATPEIASGILIKMAIILNKDGNAEIFSK